jgi:hypothetical protein
MVSSQGENTPLLGSNENQNYYFLNGNGRKFSDAGEYVEDLPPGASAEEFAPRVLNAATVVRTVLLLTFGFSTLQPQILFKIIHPYYLLLSCRNLLLRRFLIGPFNRKSRVFSQSCFQSCLGS